MSGSGTGSPPRGQGERARRVLWDLFTVSALNVAGDDASMALAATVVKTALLGAKNAADIGVPAIPLGDLHGKAGAELLQRLVAEGRIGARVAAVTATSGGGLRVRLRQRSPNPASPAFLTNENHAAALSPDAGQEGG